MLFHAAEILTDRRGTAFQEPKPKAKPQANGTFADADMREVSYGDMAMAALDASLETDKKEMEADPAKWVRAVMKRETISGKIQAGLTGDGWVDLSDEQRDLVCDRLAQITGRTTLAMVGPVIAVLQNPPKEKPTLTLVAAE